MQRRSILKVAGAGLAAQVARAAYAQPVLPGPLTVVVPFPPGGGADTSTRVIMSKLQANTGVTVLVENRPGGNTMIGVQTVARAAPDGRTIGMLLSQTTVNETLYKGRLQYHLFRDLVPVSLTHGYSHVLMVPGSFPGETLEDFIAHAKKHPGKLSYGSAAVANQLPAEMLNIMAGLDLLHVPYKGVGPLVPDLLTGRIDSHFGGLPLGIELGRDKRVKLLALTSAKRQVDLPQLSTIAERFPDYDFSTWYGFAAPAGTPPAIVNRLSAELARATNDPETVAKLAYHQFIGTTPEQFGQFLRAEVDKAPALIARAGIKAE